MTTLHNPHPKSARSGARAASAARRKIDITLAPKAGETEKLGQHRSASKLCDPSPPTPNADLIPIVSKFLRGRFSVAPYRRRAALEQDIGAVLPLLASRPEHQYPFLTRRPLTRIEELIAADVPPFEIPEHVPRFVLAR